jgi:hypothetical protein
MNQPTSCDGHLVEIGQDQRIGEEDRVVEEGLRAISARPTSPLPVPTNSAWKTSPSGVIARGRRLVRGRASAAVGHAGARLDVGDDRAAPPGGHG